MITLVVSSFHSLGKAVETNVGQMSTFCTAYIGFMKLYRANRTTQLLSTRHIQSQLQISQMLNLHKTYLLEWNENNDNPYDMWYHIIC